MKERKLRWGFTTGTAASAAAQAALLCLLGPAPKTVAVELPAGDDFSVELSAVERLASGRARAEVIKDAGDDPDVTHKAVIGAEVELLPDGDGEALELAGGVGVGIVTRPGLELAVGQPAINPVPRRMIKAALRRAWRLGGGQGPLRARATIYVPEGERLAKKTLNPRLGVLGGISILGTTGLVKPFSHEAYTATIDSGLSVARAMGIGEVVLTTGRRSEKLAMSLRPNLAEPGFIQVADFFAYALKAAAQAGMERIGLVSFFGKAVKQAQGLECTHARKAPVDLVALADWIGRAGADAALRDKVAAANTAREALEIMTAAGRAGLAACVGPRLLTQARELAGPGPRLWAAMVGYDGGVMFRGGEQEGDEP